MSTPGRFDEPEPPLRGNFSNPLRRRGQRLPPGALIAAGIVLVIVVVVSVALRRGAGTPAAAPTIAPAPPPPQVAATLPAGAAPQLPATAPVAVLQPTAAPPSTQAPQAAPTPTLYRETRVIGQSAGKRPLQATLIGNGTKPVIFVGALQGGRAPNTRDLVQQAASYYSSHPEELPPGVMAIFIPAINPDGLASGQRPNSRGIYLGNNWDIRWSPNPQTPDGRKPGGGGAQPFSEPESRALRDLVVERKARAVIFYQAPVPGGLVIPGEGPGRATSTVSLPLGELLSRTLGYRMIRTWADRTITGDPSDWLDREGVMSVIVLLPTRTAIAWNQQKRGMDAAMSFVGQRP